MQDFFVNKTTPPMHDNIIKKMIITTFAETHKFFLEDYYDFFFGKIYSAYLNGF
jgi:hypothetical protein